MAEQQIYEKNCHTLGHRVSTLPRKLRFLRPPANRVGRKSPPDILVSNVGKSYIFKSYTKSVPSPIDSSCISLEGFYSIFFFHGDKL